MLINLKASFFYMLSKLRKFYALHIIIFLIILFSMERHGFHYVSGIIGFIRDVFLNITLLQSWYDPSKFTFNGVTWFLSCIVFAYFCVPFIVHFFKKNRGGYWIISLLIILLLKITLDTCGYKMGLNPWPGVFGWYCNPIYRLLDFLIGYTGFLALNYFTWKPSTKVASVIQCLILGSYFMACHLFDKYWIPALYIFFSLLLIYCFTIPNGVFDKIFGNKILVHFGNISFELFILHQFIINNMNGILWKAIGNHRSLVFIGCFLITWVLAEFFYWSPVKTFLTKTIWGRS